MTYFPKKFIAATTEYSTKERHIPAPYFRKRFTFQKGDKGSVRICGLGFYELYLNGENVTKGRLAPYISNPDQALYYDDYDLTGKLLDGENVLGVWLGNGIQNAPYGDVWDFDKAAFRSAPKFALAFFVNGEVAFESDESFLTKPSPITFDDLRAGEHYDARLETPKWSTQVCDEIGWKPAIPAKTPLGEGKIVTAEPILVHAEIKPVSVTKTPKGAHLYDFGINFTGVCRVKIQGARGQEIRLTHGEMLLNGDLDMRSLGFDNFPNREGYTQCDRYILKGDGVETYTPRFTYHGFQYVSVEGLTDEQATLELLTFEVMHSAVKSRGEFVCSDEIAGAIQESTRRSDLSNLFYIPTDCPHREKNGWTGDIALSAEQMMLNFAVGNTLEDWLFSVRKAQDGRGAIPAIVPTGGWGFAWGAGPNWDDALFELPYQIYRYTGRREVIEDNLPAMERYLRYMQTKKNKEGLFCYGLGDWCQPKNVDFHFTTPEELTDTVKCIDICDKTAKMARAVEKVTLAVFAEETAEKIRRDFTKKYVKNGRCTVAEQTAISYILYYHVCDEWKNSLQEQLLEVIKRDGEVFTTGVLGARVLFRVLSSMNEGNLAYKLITQPRFPSYREHVLRGARTLFENFYELSDDWQRKDGKKQDSLNHHFWGDVSAWFITCVAGIKINPDFYNLDDVTISPDFISGLTFAQGKVEHRKGEISCRWERIEEGKISLFVRLPKAVNATLGMPNGYFCETTKLCAGEQTLTVYKL